MAKAKAKDDLPDDPTRAEVCEAMIERAVEIYHGWGGEGSLPTAVERAIEEYADYEPSCTQHSVLDAVLHDIDREGISNPVERGDGAVEAPETAVGHDGGGK